MNWYDDRGAGYAVVNLQYLIVNECDDGLAGYAVVC